MQLEEETRKAAQNLFAGCIPERKEEIDGLWTEYDLQFQIKEDTDNGEKLVMRGGLYRYVEFNHRMLRAFWVAGYAAWEGYNVMAGAIRNNQEPDLTRFQELVTAVIRITESETPCSEPLPAGVAEPGHYDGQDAPERAASELATFAACWAFLHEIRHIRHQREATGADTYESDPSEWHKEEISCDQFATEFLLTKIDDYARDQFVSADEVRIKREVGVYFALFTIGVLSDGKFDDTATHPALEKRIIAVQEMIGSTGTDEARMIAILAFDALRTFYPKTPSAFVM